MQSSARDGKAIANELFVEYHVSLRTEGGDMASTWVAKPEVHAEGAGFLVNPSAKK